MSGHLDDRGRHLHRGGQRDANFSPNGTAARSAVIDGPQGVTIDGNGDMLIADTQNCRIAEVPVSSGTYWNVSIGADDLSAFRGVFVMDSGSRCAAAIVVLRAL